MTVIRSFTLSPPLPATARVKVQVTLSFAPPCGSSTTGKPSPAVAPLQSGLIATTEPASAGAFLLTLSTKLAAVRCTLSTSEVFCTVTV